MAEFRVRRVPATTSKNAYDRVVGATGTEVVTFKRFSDDKIAATTTRVPLGAEVILQNPSLGGLTIKLPEVSSRTDRKIIITRGFANLQEGHRAVVHYYVKK